MRVNAAPPAGKKEGKNHSERAGEGSDSGILDRVDDDEGEDGPRIGPKNRDEYPPGELPLKEYRSIRKKKNIFSFKVGLSLGAVGTGILGPADAFTPLYRYTYNDEAFTLGFRGGADAFFILKRRHYLSLGVFFEQRKIQVKVAELGFMRVLFASVPLELLYYMPLTRYSNMSTVDTNYFSFPVAYRFYFLDDFYFGIGLDVAVLFQAKAKYNMIIYSSSVNMRPELNPVDFGGRLIFGITVNRVFVEVGLGTGFLDYDRMGGERHSIYAMGMIGYMI